MVRLILHLTYVIFTFGDYEICPICCRAKWESKLHCSKCWNKSHKN